MCGLMYEPPLSTTRMDLRRHAGTAKLTDGFDTTQPWHRQVSNDQVGASLERDREEAGTVEHRSDHFAVLGKQLVQCVRDEPMVVCDECPRH